MEIKENYLLAISGISSAVLFYFLVKKEEAKNTLLNVAKIENLPSFPLMEKKEIKEIKETPKTKSTIQPVSTIQPFPILKENLDKLKPNTGTMEFIKEPTTESPFTPFIFSTQPTTPPIPPNNYTTVGDKKKLLFVNISDYENIIYPKYDFKTTEEKLEAEKFNIPLPNIGESYEMNTEFIKLPEFVDRISINRKGKKNIIVHKFLNKK
jgi:hypothetical protein